MTFGIDEAPGRLGNKARDRDCGLSQRFLDLLYVLVIRRPELDLRETCNGGRLNPLRKGTAAIGE